MPRLSLKIPSLQDFTWPIPLLCILLGCGPFFGNAWAQDYADDDELSAALATETTDLPRDANSTDNESDDEEINVQELLDEAPASSRDVASLPHTISPADKLKKFLPFKIYQSTNNAFVRTLEQNGKVSRTYTPPICEGLRGSWEINDGMLRIKEKLHCLVDPDKPGKFGRAWFQKVEFKLEYNKGRPTLNGVQISNDNVFRVN